MRSRKREAIFMGIGVLAGLALSGPAAQAADYLTARPSTQAFYLNGEKISLTAYLIGGSNYVRLRDIGRAVDFGVTYDAATNTVYIDSTQPYQTETAQPTVTEESVQATLEQLKQTYPTGTVFPTPYRSTSSGPYGRGIHCSGWATLCSDAAFGNLPWRRIDRPSWDQIRPGDVVEYKNEESGCDPQKRGVHRRYRKQYQQQDLLGWAILPLVVGGTASLYLLHSVSAIGTRKGKRAALRGAPPKPFFPC